MIKKIIILFFIYANSCLAQTIYDNDFTGNYFQVRLGPAYNTLGVIFPVYELDYDNKVNWYIHEPNSFYSFKLTKNYSLSPYVALNYLLLNRENVGLLFGLQFQQSSIGYKYLYRDLEIPVKSQTTNTPKVYSTVLKFEEGKINRNIYSLQFGIINRFRYFNLNFIISPSFYTTGFKANYKLEETYDITTSAINYHTESSYYSNISVLNDSTSSLVSRQEFKNIKSDGPAYHQIKRPNFIALPLEINLEKTILNGNFIYQFGLRASVSVFLANYYSFGTYIGVGFGK